MARPQDWSALGMHGDPTPGDPDALSSLYQGLRDTEQLGNEITSGLNRILDESGNGFIGKTAEAVREKIDGHLKQFIDAIGQSFAVAADATMAYRNALLDTQERTYQALSGAQGLSKDDPQLAAHKDQAHSAQDDYNSAVRVFKQRMKDAEHLIRQPIDAWHLFLKSLGILEIILAIVGAIFGGWIGLLAFGLGMVMFISSLVDFAQGKAGVLDVVLAFVGILFPSTKGLNVGALAKGVFNALKNLPKSLSAGLTNIGGGLAHILTTGITFKGIYSGVTALPGLVLRGLNGLASLTMKGLKVTASGLKLLANTFRTDFQVATAGISTTLGKVAVYPISFGGRFLLGAVLPVDFFELGVGLKGAFKMGFGTRLLTPTAHLPQTALGGGLHIGALTGGHGGITGLPTGASFDGFGHGALQGFNPGGFHGLNTGIDAQFGGLHGISLGTDIGGANGSITSLHSLNGTGSPGSVGNLMANVGGLDAVDHLTAFDHATGFQRTTAGLLEPLPTNLGGTNLAGAHNLSDLGSTGLHALRGDLTPSGSGLHASFSDALSGVRAATGHVEDFHALGIPELRSIVDGDISGVRMTHEGISMQVGAQSGTPTTLHVDYRGTAVTNGEGKQVVVAPEVHEAIGTADVMAAHGAIAHGLQTPPPAATAGHVTTDVKTGATPTGSVAADAQAGAALNTSAVSVDVRAGSPNTSAATVDVKAGAPGGSPLSVDVKASAVDVRAGAAVDTKAGAGVSASGVDVKTGSVGGSSVGGDVKAGSVVGGPATEGGKGGGTGGPSAGAARTGVRDVGGLSGGTRASGAPERLAEEPASPSVTAQGDRLGVSARADLDLLGQREGTGDTAGAAAATHVKTGAGVPPTGAVRVLDDGSGAVVVGEHIALRPTPAPAAKPGPHAAGGGPAPLSKFEAVTGGVTGKTGAERLTAWNEYELASAGVADAKRQLDQTGAKIGQPSETVDQAAAKLDVQHAEGALDIAKGKMVRLGMDVESIEGHLDALGIPGPRPSRTAAAPSGHGDGAAAGKAVADGTGPGAKGGAGAAPTAVAKSLPFSPGEIERFWGLDGERVDALFGGPHDPLSGDRRQLWREFTEARYDVGRLEGQVRGDQPHAGGSSGPSAHELKLQRELSAAQANLDDLRSQLDELGVDSAHMDRRLWDLHSQSLKERPRLDGAGVRGTDSVSSSHAAGEIPKLDDLMTEHQAAVKSQPKAESAAAQAQSSYDAKAAKLKLQQEKFDQLPAGTNERALQKAKKDLDKARADVDKVKPGLDAALTELKKAQDALKKAEDDLAAGVDLHVAARDLTQRDVQRYVEKFAAEGHLDLAGVLRTHAEELTRLTRADLSTGGPVRWDQIALTGQEVKQHAGQVLTQAKDLERLLGPVTKSGHMDFVEVKVTAELKDAARGLEQSADNLGSMLEKGFIKDAASVGGVYGLRAEHGPLSFTAGKLAQRVNHALENAAPGDMVRVDGVFSTEKALADFHELGQVVRKFRSDKAYGDVPTGTQWKTVLPGQDKDWKKLYGSLDKLTPEQQQKFVRDLSERNLTKLESEVEALLKRRPDREQDLRGMLEKLKGLDYRVKHATPAYHAIANSGLMSSQGDLARRDVKFLASGKSSVKNTSSLGNDDFVFFRMDVGDAPMATRYGPTTLVFDAKVLKEHGGWVSLHDQLHPLDRPAMQKLEVEQKAAAPGDAPTSKVFRSAQYDPGFEKIGEHAKWTYKYPQSGDPARTVTFETEVFHGAHVTDALALSVVREVILMGPEYTELALKMSADDLGRLVSKLFRPEAKFGSGLPITPKSVDGLSQGERGLLGVGPEPLHVHHPDGDGRYFSDGTMDPIGRWSGKHADAADDAFRSAEHGVQENNTVKIDAHLKEAKASIEKSIELTKGWKLENPERQELIERLLKKRGLLLGDIEHLQANWRSEVKRLHGDKSGTGEAAAKPKGASPKDGAVKASKDGAAKASKDGAAKAPKPSQAAGPKVSGKPKAPAGKAGVPGAGESRPIVDAQLPAPKATGTAVTEPKAPAAEATPPGPSGPSGPSGLKVAESSPVTPSETPGAKVSESVVGKADVSVGQLPERAVVAEAHDVPHAHTAPDVHAVPDAHAAPGGSRTGPKAAGPDVGPGRVEPSVGVKGERRPDMLDPVVFRQQTSTLTGVRSWSEIRFLDELLDEYRAVPEPDLAQRVEVLRELETKARRYLAGEPDPQRVPGVELLAVQVGFQLASLSHAVRGAELSSVERLTAGDVARLWDEDVKRIDALFGGPQHPLYEERVAAWGKLTQARYDLGRIEGQVRGAQPHAGGSSGPSAHEVKVREDLAAARADLGAANQDLVRLGLDPGRVDRGLSAHYAQSLKERPRAVAGGHQPAPHPAGGQPHALDDLLAEHTKVAGQVPSAKVRLEDATVARDGALAKSQAAKEKFETLKSEYDQLPEPTKQQTRQYQKAQKEAESEEKNYQAQQAKFDARKAELDAADAKVAQAWRALDGAVDDLVGAGTHSQQELSRLVDTFAGMADLEHAARLQQHARALDISARGGLDGPDPRPDQVLWTGKDVEEQAKRIRVQAAELEVELSYGSKATPADVQAQVDQLRASVGKLHGMLDGFVTDAAPHGGVYALRNTHGPLALAAGHLVDLADDAIEKAGPDTAVRLTDPFNTHTAAEGLRNGATHWLRDFRTGKAYADVPTGTQWQAVLPAHELPRAEPKGPREEIAQQEAFVQKLSQKNIENLRQEIDTLIGNMPPERQEAFRALKKRLLDLPYRIKHATPAYHAIANSGVMSSQGDLARRNVKHLASGKSSANNTTNLGNDDFVFFRMEVGDGAMASRYGPTTLVFDAKVLEEHGGWVSLHDQLHPLDRKTMQELLLNEKMAPVTEPAPGAKVFRTGQYDAGFTDIGKRAQWTHTYPQNSGAARTVTFEQEVFHGQHVVEGLALSVIREVDSIGGAFPAHVLGLDMEGLGKVVSQLFRPEAKFGSGLPITPMNAVVLHGRPQPLRVINEHGDGRYFADGTIDPVARAAGKQHDMASDALRQADNSRATGHGGKAKDHLKDAKAHAQQSVDLTKTFQEGATGERRDLATKLLEERTALFRHIDTKLTNWQATENAPAVKPSGAKGPSAKGAAGPKASGSKTPAVQGSGATPPDAEGTRLHTALSPLFGDRTTPDLMSVARGLVEHGDLNAPTEAGKTFGLSKRAYDKVSKDLEGKGLVRRVNGGLLLTDQGGRLLLPPGARPEPQAHVSPSAHTGSTAGSAGRDVPWAGQYAEVEKVLGPAGAPLREAWAELTQARQVLGDVRKSGREPGAAGTSQGVSALDVEFRGRVESARADFESAFRKVQALGVEPKDIEGLLGRLDQDAVGGRGATLGAGPLAELPESVPVSTDVVRLSDSGVAGDNGFTIRAERGADGTLSHQVLDVSGQPVPDRTVTALDGGGHRVHDARSGVTVTYNGSGVRIADEVPLAAGHGLPDGLKLHIDLDGRGRPDAVRVVGDGDDAGRFSAALSESERTVRVTDQHTGGVTHFDAQGHRKVPKGRTAPEGKEAKKAQHTKVIDPRLRTMLVQNGYATGDQFGVAAALHADPGLRVLLIRDAKDFRDRSTEIRDFYTASGIGPDRVRLVDAPADGNTKKLKLAHWQDFNGDVLKLEDVAAPSNKDIEKKLIGPVGTATTVVGERFSTGLRDTLRSAWGLDDAHFTPELQGVVKTWLKDRGVPDVAGRDVVVLWTRFSGKRGEIHVEHDTSHTGLRQILSGLHSRTADRPRRPLVILAGDASVRADRPSKFPAISTEFRNLGLEVHDLTAFWKDPKGLTAWGGNTRVGQMRLFEYLNRATDGRFRHLGFRSGNLEAMALSGHQVRYLEETGSIGGDRMAKWHEVDGSGLTANQALAPGYERIVVDHPPTRSGQVVVGIRDVREAKKAEYKGKPVPAGVQEELNGLTDAFEHPSWVPGSGDRPYVRNIKPVADHHTKGFDLRDVDRVVDYLAAPHAVTAPASGPAPQPVSGTPLPPPARMTVTGQIGGADRVLPSQEAAATVTRDLVAHFDDVLTPAQRDTLRADLQAQLSREVWPSLSAMTRGETRTLTMDVAGFSGDITVRAKVMKAEPDGVFKSLEFEDGSESLVRDGFQRETRSVVTAGVLVKGKAAAQTDLTGHLSSNWSRTESHRMTSGGRLFSRTKTPEPALRLDVEVRLEFDFSAVGGTFGGTFGKHLTPAAADGARAERVEVSAKVPVAVAEGDVRPSAGMRHYLPPSRVEQTLALGGMDTVRDLFLVDADGERVSGTLHKALLGSGDEPHSLESYGQRAFGGRWPEVRELVLDRIGSLDSLQYRLKGMTAGEALEIDLGPDAGSLLVTAEVTTMKHLRNTDKTEFNTGSDVTRVYTCTRSCEHGVRATMQAQSADLHAGPTTVTGVGHGEFDRDGALTVQESVRTGTAVKMKVPGAVFDGVATLSFVHRADPLGAPAPASSPAHAAPPGGRARLGFEVLVDAADARPVAEPGVFSAAARPQGPRRMAAPALQQGDHAWRPSAGVWDGLPSRTVVLDVLSGEERALGAAQSPRLADLVDGVGREHFGADWAVVRPAAHDMATREQLAATLPQLTRGTTARSAPLPLPLRSNAQLSLSGRLESLEYVRTLDAAEINLLSDVADETGGRLGSAFGHGQLAQGGVQPELGSDFTLAVHAPGGGIAHRYRTADGVSGGHSSVAGAKYPEPMAVYIATVGVDAHVGRVGETATHGGRTDVRFVVAVPKSHTQRYEVTTEAAGTQVFHRPDSVAPPRPGPAPAAAELSVRPPLRVSDSGRIGNGDAVLELPGDKVVKELERQLSGTFGERWGQVEGEVAQFFDSIALQPRTAGLTAGDTWGGSFRAGPVTADIRITAADAKMTEYVRVEKDFEFEQGSESATVASVQKDTHVRRTLWERAGFKAPHVTFTLGHVRHNESVAGRGADVRGGVVAKNKTVEPAAVFKGEVTYTVRVKVSHALPGRGGERTFTVVNDGEFAFPARDLPADPATGAAHRPEQYRRVPDRIADSLRLGAEDVVLDIRPTRTGADAARADASGTRLVEDVLRQLDPNGPKLFGSAADWKAARAKLAERLPASEFQRRLRSMMAGQPWVIRVHGRELAIRASVQEMTHTADTKATEFNSAAVEGAGGGRTEAGPNGPQITSDGTNVTVVGTSDPIGGSPAEVFGGGTLAHTTQSEHLADSSSGIRSAAGTKTKVPGSVYDGVARLHFEVRDRWRPFGRGVDTQVPKAAVDEQIRFKALRQEVADLRKQFDEASTAGLPQQEADALKTRLDQAKATFDKALTDHTTRIREAVDTRRTGQGTLGFAPMTKRTFGVRVRGVGEADIGFQALLPSADTVKVAGPDQARFTAPELGAGRPRPPRQAGAAPAQVEVPRPPESLLARGMSDGQLVRDLPDVQSLRSLLDSEGGRVFGGAWSDVTRTGQRRGELVMGGFTKDRLMAALPELTRGGELRGEPFRVNGREAWVSVRAEVLDLTHARPEPKAEVALAAEKSYVFGRRDLHSRQFFLLGQVGAVAGTLESKLGAAVTFGGGFRRRTRGDQVTGGRTFTNAKIPTPLEHYDGHVEFTFTFHRGGTDTHVSGVVPVGVSVPSAQITEHVVVDQGHVFTRPAAERPPAQQRAQLESFAQKAGFGFTVGILEPGAVRPAARTAETPAGDGTLVSAHTGAVAPDDVFTAHTSVAKQTPARGKVANGTHVTVEEESVPVRAPEAAGTAHTAPVEADLAEAFDAVRQRFPDALVHTGRWTMWGHDGDTPHTSAYAIENGALGLRGVFVPPAADGSVGAWHWHLPGHGGPVAVTPLRLPTTPATHGVAATPARIAADAAGPLVSALETAPWGAGLHWRADDEELYVFAGAGAEQPAAVFADGLRPAGGRLVHVAAHVGDGGAPDSAWLTATRKIGWLREQAAALEDGPATELLGRYGWRYDIAAPGGVDVDATLDLAAPHPERAEVLYPGGVDGRHIRGAQRLEAGRAVGAYVTNPGFVEPGRPVLLEGSGR